MPVAGVFHSINCRSRPMRWGRYFATMASMTILTKIAANAVLDAAFAWLCKRRRDYPADADVWDFRRKWPTEKAHIRAALLAGRFRFGLLTRITLADGEEVDLWSARDALVLKAMTYVLGEVLPISDRCTHVKGHGGAKAAVRQVVAELPDNRFVLRTDVKSYYASIDHFILLDQLAEYVKDRHVLNLLGQYLRRSSERGGHFFDYERGISLGCPLSPLIGAFFLNDMDRRMTRSGLFYVRFMDDILVLSPTRWKIRKAVKLVNGILASLGLQKHPDKTFIGRIEKGFDFLGYHFSRDGLSVAQATVKKFVERATRLYEQERERPESPSALGLYVRRWLGWARGGQLPPLGRARLGRRSDGAPTSSVRPPGLRVGGRGNAAVPAAGPSF